MTICPIAIVAGCQKCPAFKICPVKSVFGDAPKSGEEKSDNGPKKTKKAVRR